MTAGDRDRAEGRSVFVGGGAGPVVKSTGIKSSQEPLSPPQPFAETPRAAPPRAGSCEAGAALSGFPDREQPLSVPWGPNRLTWGDL